MDLLVGGDVYFLIMPSGVRKDLENNLIAQPTVFGWIVSYKMGQSNELSFKSVSSKDLSLGPSRNGALAQSLRSDCYRTPKLKPNTRKLLTNTFP